MTTTLDEEATYKSEIQEVIFPLLQMMCWSGWSES